MEEEKKDEAPKEMKCMGCGKEKDIKKGKVSPSGTAFLCDGCDELIGKGPGY